MAAAQKWKEIICLHVGQAGCAVGRELWELFCEEHNIQPDGTRDAVGDVDEHDMGFNSVFNDTSSGQFVPRAIFVDTDPSTKQMLYQEKHASLFHPDNVLSFKKDCANNFFEGWTAASSLHISDEVMDRIRVAVAACNNLQGFFIFNSIGGGTGSGLGSYIMQQISEEFPKKVIMQPLIYPSKMLSSCVVEPYNAVLALHYSRDTAQLSLMLDNEASYQICKTQLEIKDPDFKDLNHLIAQVVSCCTVSLRYASELNATLDEMVHNIVPTQHLRYPILALSPICSTMRGTHEKFSTPEICTDLFEKHSWFADCGSHFKMNRYFAAVVVLRGTDRMRKDATGHIGGPPPLAVNEAIAQLHMLRRTAPGRVPLRFVPWVKEFGFKVGVCGQPPCLPMAFRTKMKETDRQGALLANTTAVRHLFVRQYTKYLKLMFWKSYVHHYIEAAGSVEDMQEAKEGVRDIIDEYERQLHHCVEDEFKREGGVHQVGLVGETFSKRDESDP